MTEDREFEGKDLEEALGAAAAALGIPEDDLHYEMVEQGRRGVLGLGVKAVRIRVKPPIETELPEDGTDVETGPTEPAAPAGRAPKRPKPKPKPKLTERGSTAVAPEHFADIEKTVREIVERMGLEIEVNAEVQESGVSLRMEGPDQKMLLAKNAELLCSMQFLLNRMARRAWPSVGRIHIACNGHSRPRDEELVATARKVAEQVSRTGKTRKLQPLNAYERRLVHLTVREFSGLTSNSDGKGALKRIRISKVQNQI